METKVQVPSECERTQNIVVVKEALWAISKARESGILIKSHLDEMIYDESGLKFGEIKRWE